MKAALYCKFPVDETGGPEILEQELILISLLQKIDGELYAIYVDRGHPVCSRSLVSANGARRTVTPI